MLTTKFAVRRLAAALALTAAGGVQALPLSNLPADLNVFVSGASAQDQGLERMFRLQCNPGTLDIFRGASGTNQAVFFCRISSPTVPSFPSGLGSKVAFHKSSAGGSGNGVGPVARATPLQFMNLAALVASDCPGVSVSPSGGFPAYVNHINCPAAGAALQSRVPDAGLSDLEPARFRNQFTPPLTAAELNRLTVRSANAVVFGIPVTRALRNALQRAQLGPTCVGKETVACMPSMNVSLLRSLFTTGGLTNWNQVVIGGGPLPTRPGVTPPSDQRVFISRRVRTSGTYVASAVFFTGETCGQPATFRTANDGGVCGNNTVNEGSGSSNVRACMTAHNTANRWAIGMLSTENVFNRDSSGSPIPAEGWRFIKLINPPNTAEPTIFRTANRTYGFFFEQAVNWRRTAPQPLMGLKLALMTKLSNDLGQPAIVRSLNVAFQNGVGTPPPVFGDGGLLALCANGFNPPASIAPASIRANPVTPLTKPNSCLAATLCP